jgi:hypothetical protein
MKQIDAKAQKYFAVSRAILEIIESHGEKSLTHSEIARLSKVSRAWIYEYMGKDKEDLVNVAADVFGGFFTRPKKAVTINSATDLQEMLRLGLEATFDNVKEEPVIIKLYYRFRGTPTPIGEVIKKYEKHWLDYMSAHFMRILNMNQKNALNVARTILTIRLGFSHRAATSSTPAKDIAEAKEAMDLIYLQIF